MSIEYISSVVLDDSLLFPRQQALSVACHLATKATPPTLCPCKEAVPKAQGQNNVAEDSC